jgi:hypothetical protein
MSDKRIAANRRNALRSTGPRTAEGKRRTSMNALKHGLRSVSLAVPHLENPEDWAAHLDLVVRDLAPVGYLETILAERVAALLWRLGRVVRYESEAVSIRMSMDAVGTSYGDNETLQSLETQKDHREADVATLRRVKALKGTAHVSGEDASAVLEMVANALRVELFPEGVEPVHLDIPGVPDGPEDYWDEFDGWTRNLVNAGVQALKALAPDFNVDPWEFAHTIAYHEASEARKHYESRVAEVDRKLRESLLPPEDTLEKVTRYETHLERSLFRTLHELQRLQAVRAGGAVPVPAALDVDVAVSREAV